MLIKIDVDSCWTRSGQSGTKSLKRGEIVRACRCAEATLRLQTAVAGRRRGQEAVYLGVPP